MADYRAGPRGGFSRPDHHRSLDDRAPGAGSPSPAQGEGWGEGRLASPGSIGGMLTVCDPNDANDANGPAGDFVYAYDAMGSVGPVLSLSRVSHGVRRSGRSRL